MDSLSTSADLPPDQPSYAPRVRRPAPGRAALTYAGNSPRDHQLIARHSGKCVDVSTISTAPRAPVHQWTCNPAGQAGPPNQTWRLRGR
ncbi:RICIN domain-containing protein [Nonomuraea sp. NPDC050153]|uniref:RICIN domain-containing protein n=1 Tax=Nonomuraea sp. NPDC050153 TaxID=3364359 RepID=UPI0037B0CA64